MEKTEKIEVSHPLQGGDGIILLEDEDDFRQNPSP